jgi:hypothetical protein
VGYPISVAVSGAPTLIYTPSASGKPNVFLQNMGTAPVYVGGSGVTATGGLYVPPNQGIDIASATSALYAVAGYTATATTTTIATSAVSHGSAVSVTVASGAGTANGQYVLVGAGTSAETTTITSGGGTTTLVLAQLLDDHNVGAPVTVVVPIAGVLNVAPGTV